MSMQNNNVLLWRSVCSALLSMLFASASFADAIAKNDAPDDRALFHRAVSLTAHGDWLAAQKIFKQISLRQPDWPEPKNNLAVALFNQGQISLAQQALEDAVISLPGFKVAQENRKRLYDHAAAVAYLKAIGKHKKLPLPQLQILSVIDAPAIKQQSESQAVKPANEDTKPANASAERLNQADSRRLIYIAVEKAVMQWSVSWSELHIDEYLAAYSIQFNPAYPVSDYTQWRKQRRAKFRLTTHLQIKLQDVKVYLRDNEIQAYAEFTQYYKADKYQDKVTKQLQLIFDNDRWLIQSERVLQQLN
jgi:hypothetical protein